MSAARYLELRNALLMWFNSPEPVADIWDTESGQWEEGADATVSDWSRHYADGIEAQRLDRVRSLVGLPPLLAPDDFRLKCGPTIPASKGAG